MSKAYNVHHSWDFVVTHKVPCPECNQLVTEEEMIKRRSRWIAGYGWKEFPVSCEPCYDKAVKECEDTVKQQSGLYWGNDYV